MRKIKGSFSEADQESFVINFLGRTQNGYYVKITGYRSTIASNTYILDDRFGLKGVGLEIDLNRTNEYNSKRKNICLNCDTLKLNSKRFDKIFMESHMIKNICSDSVFCD
jgi:hypothetical protein